jgi:esterase/lipase
MNIVIIPGFTGYPEEKTFEELDNQLSAAGHSVIKIAWPHFPDNLQKYSITETLNYSRSVMKSLDSQETTILGFSMGGIIASYLAGEFEVKKLGLIVAPYQAGSDEDLQGKYKDWSTLGYRDLTSSRFGNLRFPFSFIEDARKYNVLDVITKVHCPILCIVGEKDEKVSNDVTEKIFQKANQPKTWRSIPDMKHKYQYQPEILPEVNELILDFINT